jgi:hypothetical protein
MRRIALALKAFFIVLLHQPKSPQIEAAVDGAVVPKLNSDAKPQQVVQPAPAATAGRSDALTLLAALQREARLVDLVKQPLTGFSDEEIGAAARNVLTDSGAVLDRFFALRPLLEQEEGSSCDVTANYDPGCYKLSGRVEGNGPFRGQLVHHGWKATTVKLPTWTGSKEAAMVIAPAEIEINASSSSPSPRT